MPTKEAVRPTKEKNLTTKEVADRLVEFCRKGQFDQAQKELFDRDAESIEPDSAAEQGWTPRIKGLDSILKKGEQWQNMLEQHHGGSVSDPIVAGNRFAIALAMDVTMKGKPRMQMEEIIVYEVKDGKILSEQFFF